MKTRPNLRIPALLALTAAAVLPSVARADGDPAADARRRLRRTPIVEAVEKARPSVVSIGTNQLVRRRFVFWGDERQTAIVPGGLGSGVIMHPRGYVITNLHVINQAYEIFVKLTGMGDDETEIPAKLVAVDQRHDLALLRMVPEGPYPAASMGRTDDLMVGETVIAMGNPYGIGQTVTTGVVSALDRTINIGGQEFAGLVQTDAAVNRGNSGGALLNILGDWVGVNSAIYSPSGGSDGISFAIPIETVRDFLADQLRPRRVSDSWLGIEFGRNEDGEPGIVTVFPVGPAARLDIPSQARIVAVDGVEVAELYELRLAVLDALPRGRVRLRVQSADGEKDFEVPFEALPTDRLLWSRLGLKVEAVRPPAAETEGYREGTGVVVADVRVGGPAERIGLRKGDLLSKLGPRPVASLDDVLLVVQYLNQGQTVPVGLGRQKRNRFNGVYLEEMEGSLVVE